MFKRAIMQSGACVGVLKPLVLEHKIHRSRFDRLSRALSLENLSPDSRVGKLRTLPWKKLIEVMAEVETPDSMFCITADRELRDGFWKFQEVPAANRSLLIGNTRHDVLCCLLWTRAYFV